MAGEAETNPRIMPDARIAARMEMAMMGKKKTMIIGPKTDGILAGALTVASGGWLIGVLLGYFQWQDWGHVLGLFVLFGIGVASLLAEIWLGIRDSRAGRAIPP